MKKTVLRFTAFFLTVMLSFSALHIAYPFEVTAQSENLITNGGFESGTVGWGSEKRSLGEMDSNRILTDSVNSGTSSATVPSGWNHYIYTKFNCTANTDYILQFYTINANGVNLAVSPTMDYTDALCFRSGHVPEGIIIQQGISNSDSWSKTQITFNSGENTVMYIAFYNPYEGKGTIRIDDVSVRVDKYAGLILRNGGFEDGTDDWTADSEFTVQQQDGGYVLHAQGGYYNTVYQKISVTENTNYTLKFRYKGTLCADYSHWSISHTQSSFQNGYTVLKGTLSSSEDWTDYSAVFNSGANTTLYLTFRTVFGCDYYADDIEITATDDSAQSFTAVQSPSFIAQQSTVRYICTEENNLITDSSFESGSGNWNTEAFIKDGLQAVSDSSAVSGSKTLKLSPTGISGGAYDFFFVEVEPQTDYAFSVWVKGEAWSQDNKNDMTFGITDAETGDFLASNAGTNDDRRYTADLQLCPPSWDGEWHLVGLTFNSGDAQKVGVTVYSESSVAYFDDMYFAKLSLSQKYSSPATSITAVSVSAAEPATLTCEADDNLIENYDFSDTSSDYWQTGLGYGENVKISDASYSVGNVLHYMGTKTPEHKYYIKYVDVTPNTNYTFSAEYCVLEKGSGAIGIIDGSTYLPESIASFDFSDNELYQWERTGINFNSGGHTRIGIFVYDGGGEALIDNIYLFERIKVNTQIANGGFEDGTDKWTTGGGTASTDVYYEGVSSFKLSTKQYNKLIQQFEVSPDTDYDLIFYYNGQADTSYVRWSVSDTSGAVNGNERIVGGDIYSTGGEWKRIKVTFNSGDNTALYFNISSHGASVNMYIDNVSVGKNPDNGKIVKNGDFEDDTYRWTVDGNGTASADEYYEGSASVKLSTTQYHKVYQQVTLEANTDYYASFYYKGSGYFKWGISTTNSPDNLIGTAGAGLWGSSQWKHVQVLFNTGDYTELYFTFMSGSNNISIYIDNVSIYTQADSGNENESTDSKVEEYTRECILPLGKAEKADSPQVLSYTESSIELVADEACEYRIDSGDWQSSAVFYGLEINKEYKIYARYAETSVKTVGEASEPLVFTIPASNGDANADKAVNGTDLTVLKKLLLDVDVEYSTDGCDSNGDTVINIKDLINLKKRTSGAEATLSQKVSLNTWKSAQDGYKTSAYNEYERLGFNNEYEYLIARDGFIYGMDSDWFVTNVNGDFHLADNQILGRKSAFAPELIYSELYNMKAMGYNATNVWLFTSGQGMVFDENGTVTGLDPEFIQNVRLFLEMCREIGIDCVPSILPHGTASNYGGGSDTETATEIWNKYFRFYYNQEARKAYIENAVAPLCELFAEFTDVIPICNLTIENTNYTDDMERGYYLGYSIGTTWENMKSLINDMNACVKSYMPQMLTSTENMGDSFLQFRCNETEVDLIGQNRYASGTVKDPATEYLTKPTYLGEFNTGSATEETVSKESVRLNFYPNAKSNGYKGGFYFNYSTGGDVFSIFEGLHTELTTLFPFAVEMSYQVRGLKASHHGDETETDIPVLLYNRGNGEICWFGGKNAVSFIVESSADKGKTWQTVAKLSAEDCTLENGLCSTADTVFSDGMTLCYRVTAVTASGEEYVSVPNNSVQYDPNTEILQDADFEAQNLTDGAWINSYGGAGSISTDNAYSGEACLLVDKLNGKGGSSWSKTTQTVTLKPNTAYVLTAYVNITRGSSMSVRAYDNDNKVNMGIIWLPSSTDGWQKITLKFATSDGTSTNIIIDNGTGSNTLAIFDAFSLKEFK